MSILPIICGYVHDYGTSVPNFTGIALMIHYLSPSNRKLKTYPDGSHLVILHFTSNYITKVLCFSFQDLIPRIVLRIFSSASILRNCLVRSLSIIDLLNCGL